LLPITGFVGIALYVAKGCLWIYSQEAKRHFKAVLFEDIALKFTSIG